MMLRQSPRKGVTVIEIMISLVLVATVLLVSLTASANLLRQNAEAEAVVLVDQLFQRLQDFTRGTLPEDDRTLVIAKIKESGTE